MIPQCLQANCEIKARHDTEKAERGTHGHTVVDDSSSEAQCPLYWHKIKKNETRACGMKSVL